MLACFCGDLTDFSHMLWRALSPPVAFKLLDECSDNE